MECDAETKRKLDGRFRKEDRKNPESGGKRRKEEASLQLLTAAATLPLGDNVLRTLLRVVCSTVTGTPSARSIWVSGTPLQLL